MQILSILVGPMHPLPPLAGGMQNLSLNWLPPPHGMLQGVQSATSIHFPFLFPLAPEASREPASGLSMAYSLLPPAPPPPDPAPMPPPPAPTSIFPPVDMPAKKSSLTRPSSSNFSLVTKSTTLCYAAPFFVQIIYWLPRLRDNLKHHPSVNSPILWTPPD